MFSIYKKSVGALLFVSFMFMTTTANAGWFDWWKSDYTKTKYPIVLAHGLMGFDSILGLVDYWPCIAEGLEDDGSTVYITEVSTVNNSYERGEQLLAQIEEIISISGAEKVNIFGHSQGSIDARYVATVRPDLVASITSIGGPHGGASFGDFGDSAIIETVISLLGDMIALLSGNSNPTDVEALYALAEDENLQAFNTNFPVGLPVTECGEGAAIEYIDGYAVNVYSWGGTANITTGIDPTDVLFAILGSIGNSDEANDGMVGQCSSHLGDVIRDDYFQNHIDLTNLMFGLTSIFESSPQSIFRSHANRLKNAGL